MKNEESAHRQQAQQGMQPAQQEMAIVDGCTHDQHILAGKSAQAKYPDQDGSNSKDQINRAIPSS